MGRFDGDPQIVWQIISDEKKGSVKEEFPEEWKYVLPDELYRAAERHIDRALTAKKILDSHDYDKNKKKPKKPKKSKKDS